MTLHREFLPEPLPVEPLELVERWLAEAVAANYRANPNAMILATADGQGVPHARVVLCKDLRVRPGYVTFFTNYRSHKARELADNPRAAAVMHWDRLGRQVRLEGRVVQITTGESDAYFASRPWQSRIGAWASCQSEPIGSRDELTRAMQAAAQRFGVPSPLAVDAAAPDPGVPIARPPHWGGYHLWIEAVELWVAGDARLHDRARWQRALKPRGSDASHPTGATFDTGPWQATRLQP